MEFLLKVLDDSIPGIIYLAALFFFLLRYFNRDLDILKNNNDRNDKDNKGYKEVILYFIVLMVFISHIINGMAQTLLSHVIHFKIAIPTDNEIILNKEKRLLRIDEVYRQMVVYRHLFLSIITLGIALFIWVKDKTTKWKIAKIIGIISLIILLCYFLIANDFALLKKDIDIITKIHILIISLSIVQFIP